MHASPTRGEEEEEEERKRDRRRDRETPPTGSPGPTSDINTYIYKWHTCPGSYKNCRMGSSARNCLHPTIGGKQVSK
jgi:hypothetical protein